MVLDEASGEGWLFGGEAFYQLNGTLRRFSTNPAEPVWQSFEGLPGPPPRARAVFTRDAATGKAYLFGGEGYGALLDDLWELDPSGPAWKQLTAKSGPSPRHGAVSWFDSVSGRMVVGLGQGYYALAEDWFAFDPKAGSWSKLTIAGSAPPPRLRAQAAWDASAGVAWLFGGEGYYTLHADLYQITLTGSKLTVTTPKLPTGPVPARTGGCAFADDGRILLVGGQTWYGLVPLAHRFDLSANTLTTQPGIESHGGVCLRRPGGTLEYLLGQGYYAMSQAPWTGTID
jgi:hypothetical protein